MWQGILLALRCSLLRLMGLKFYTLEITHVKRIDTLWRLRYRSLMWIFWSFKARLASGCTKIGPFESKCFRKKSGKSSREAVSAYCLSFQRVEPKSFSSSLMNIGKRKKPNSPTFTFTTQSHSSKSARTFTKLTLICSAKRSSRDFTKKLTILSSTGTFTTWNQIKEFSRKREIRWLSCALQVCFRAVSPELCFNGGVMIRGMALLLQGTALRARLPTISKKEISSKVCKAIGPSV